METTPLVSVIMALFNGEKHLNAAVFSILNQTLTNFELIIIDDQSSDQSLKMAKTFKDHRIRILENPVHSGPSETRNHGIREAKGELIAIMDADDISFPERLEKQSVFLRNHPGIAGCGTTAIHLDVTYSWGWEAVTGPEKIRCELLFQNCFVHSSMMVRKKFIETHNFFYNTDFQLSEDYEWLAGMNESGKFENLPQPLVGYRFHEGQISSGKKFDPFDLKIKRRQLLKLVPFMDKKEEAIHQRISGHNSVPAGIPEIRETLEWMKILVKANGERNIYPEPEFTETVKLKGFRYCLKNSRFGIRVFTAWLTSSLSRNVPVNWIQKFKFAWKCLTRNKI